MSTGGSDRAKEEYLKSQNQAAQTQYNTTLEAYKPSEYENALNTEGLAWLKATSGDQPLDVGKLPGMAPYMSLFRNASAGQANERMGLGSMALGANFANPNMLAALKEQIKNKRIQDAGGQLETAFATKDAAVRGMAMPLINTGENRNQARLNTTAGMASNNLNTFAKFQKPMSFWERLALSAAGGAAQAATMGAGGGG